MPSGMRPATLSANGAASNFSEHRIVSNNNARALPGGIPMVADHHHKAQAQGILSRGGPALAVIGIHLILIYAISASMGIVPVPTIIPASKVVLIDEQPEVDPVPVIKPDIKPPTEI